MIGENLSVKLLDFGLANVCEENDELTTVVGTPYYVAPEVYSEECDLWSMGVVLFILLSGNVPFVGNNPAELLDRVATAKYEIDPAVWDPVSENAKDLVKNLQVKDPTKRLTTE
jgi:serine/threonine protein kinase